MESYNRDCYFCPRCAVICLFTTLHVYYHRAAAAAETKAPAPATAPTARGMLVGHPSEAVEQKTVQRASAPTFLQRAEELKEAVEARRALNDSVRLRRVMTDEYAFVLCNFHKPYWEACHGVVA